MEGQKPKYSIILPVYNEEKIISKVASDLGDYLKANLHDETWEAILVNDGSTDRSAEEIEKMNGGSIYRIEKHPYNKGYGASLKTGARAARGEYLIFYDADGQHRPEDLVKLIEKAKSGYDMVVGSRQSYNGPSWRKPGKKFITMLANYLVSFKIPDLNSGLRLVQKNRFNDFKHLYPNGFSLSTTITLSFLKEGLSVAYVPIEVNRRTGESSVRIFDGISAINLVLRMIMLFSPLRIFLPISTALCLLGMVSLAYDLTILNINDNTVLLLIGGIMIFFFGYIADHVASIRREMRM